MLQNERPTTGPLLSYTLEVEPERRAIMDRRALREITAEGTGEPLKLAFLLYMCSYGIRMTEHVDEYLRRSGERCFGQLVGCALESG